MVQETPTCQVGDYVRIVKVPVLHDIVGCIAAIDRMGPVPIYAVSFSPFPERYFIQLMKIKLVRETDAAKQAGVSPVPLALVHFFSSHNISVIKVATQVAALSAQFTEKFVGIGNESKTGEQEIARYATNGGA
jgi:hypothetical protein